MSVQGSEEKNRSVNGRRLILLFTALITLILPLVITIVVCLPIALKIGNTHDYLSIVPVLALVTVVWAAAVISTHVIWMVLMSFYLSMDEFSVIITPAAFQKRTPILSPLIQQIDKAMLAWKVRREK